MKIIHILLIFPALAIISACSRTVNSASTPTETIEVINPAQAYNDSILTQAESDFIKSIFGADTVDYYTGVSIYASKKLNDSVCVLVYSLSNLVGSDSYIITFCNQVPVSNEIIGSEADADYIFASYGRTEFETKDTILFKITDITERVKDTSLITPDGMMKEGYSFEDVQTVVDSVSYYVRVSPKGKLDTLTLK